jgi:hypothetical protein
MYFLIVTLCIVVLPLLSVSVAGWVGGAGWSAPLFAQWYVIWAVGARLTLAGVRQSLQPRYTAQVILSLKHEESLVLVRELGFANLALGSAGLACAWFPPWVPAVALAGAVFYALAGANHLLRPHRSSRETFAMLTDLLAALVLGGVLWATVG